MFGYRFSNLLGSREQGVGSRELGGRGAALGEAEAKLIYPFTLPPLHPSPFYPLTPHLFRIDDRCVELTEAD